MRATTAFNTPFCWNSELVITPEMLHIVKTMLASVLLNSSRIAKSVELRVAVNAD